MGAVNIYYVGNSTSLDEDGRPEEHQTRYEQVDSGWLRRRYDHTEDGKLVDGKWFDVRRKLAVEGGVYSNLIDQESEVIEDTNEDVVPQECV